MELKIAILIVLVSVTNIFGSNTYSQSAKVTLDIENKTLEQVMDEIEQQSEFYFVFNQKQIDINRKVKIRVEDKLIDEVLPDLFQGTNVNYAILDRKILLTTEDLKNASTLYTHQQQFRVSGTVKDASTGEAMPGVNVLVKGSTTGTLTDADGKYSFTVPDNNAILVFSFIGYSSLEIPVEGRLVIDVKLNSELTALEEVVVVGYGTQRKATLSGSVSAVEGVRIVEAPVINVSNSLAGRLPGVFAVTRSGEPGNDNATIRIRGSNTLGDNSALIIVDGIPGRSLSRIDPNTIETITVLKDVSAAIYGAQAANGVILITTKRGKTGKPKISVVLNQSVAQPTILPKSLNASEYALALNEINFYRGQPARYTNEEILKFADGSDPWRYPNTDWFDETFKKWSNQNNANISASGGSENMKYFVSVGTKHQDSYYKSSATYYNQYDFRSNLDINVQENIELGFDLVGRLEDSNYPMGNNGTNDIFRMLMRGKPTDPAFWPNGLPGPDIEYGSNPVIITTNQTGYNRDQNYVVNSNFKLNIKIPWVKGLAFAGNAALDKDFSFQKAFQKPWYLYSWDRQTFDSEGVPVLIKGQKGVSDPNLTERMDLGTSFLLNGILKFDSKIGINNNISLMAGIEKRYGNSDWFNAYRRYFQSTSLDQLSLGGVDEMKNAGSGSHYGRLHYFGRMNYNFKEKYLAEFVWRLDGSYIFPDNSRWGFFPGISVGWRLSKENFWDRIASVISDFKVRASYGQTGNDRVSTYQFITTYAFRGQNQNQVFNIDEENNCLYEARIPNPNITWEVATQGDLGFDAVFFKDKLSITFDYFNNQRSKILTQRNASIPRSTGLTLPSENIGKVSNTGFDFDINYKSSINNLQYSVSLSGVYANNKIKFWDEAPGAPDYQQSTGRPMGTSLYYNAIGIFKDQEHVNSYPHWAGARPGDIIFEDVNGDEKIDGNDRVRRQKTNMPTFQSGLRLDLQYKQLSLSTFFQGSAGAERYVRRESGEIGNYARSDFEGRWTPDNTDSNKPRLFNRDDEYWASNQNTYYIYNTDYVRLKNFRLGYLIPLRLTEKLSISELEVYFSGYNIWTISPGLIDYDPEDSSSSQINYPLSRILNLGFSLTF